MADKKEIEIALAEATDPEARKKAIKQLNKLARRDRKRHRPKKNREGKYRPYP